MGRASTLSLHKRGQINVLSTSGHTVKQIADVVKRSRKPIMNSLRHQEEYGTKKSRGRPSKLNGREKRGILRTTSSSMISINEIRRTCGIDASKITVWRTLDKCPNIVRLGMKMHPQLIQKHRDGRLRFGENCARILGTFQPDISLEEVLWFREHSALQDWLS
uniref:HTH_Tnp_Tc3_1 domain-containing protein n=1 Tax=Heterorhabditis bacteriophora TaxID=37862 RepID=A0A1I7X491_HETBA